MLRNWFDKMGWPQRTKRRTGRYPDARAKVRGTAERLRRRQAAEARRRTNKEETPHDRNN